MDGQRNGVYHQLDAGSLRNTGQIWVHSWDSYQTPGIAEVFIQVWKDESFFDEKKCELSVKPYDTGSGKQFGKACGSVPTGYYFIVAWKDYDDGRNVKAQGNLITN